MDEIRIDAAATRLSRWATADVRAAYRLAVIDVYAAIASGVAADIAASEEEAAMFAHELIRRGEL